MMISTKEHTRLFVESHEEKLHIGGLKTILKFKANLRPYQQLHCSSIANSFVQKDLTYIVSDCKIARSKHITQLRKNNQLLILFYTFLSNTFSNKQNTSTISTINFFCNVSFVSAGIIPCNKQRNIPSNL